MSGLHQQIERVADELTDICIAALKEHGVFVEHGGRVYEELFAAMSTLARPK